MSVTKISYRIADAASSNKIVEARKLVRTVQGRKEVFGIRRMPKSTGIGFYGWCVDHCRTGYRAGSVCLGNRQDMIDLFNHNICAITDANAQTIADTPALNGEFA